VTPLIRLVSRTVLPIAFLISLTHLLRAEHGPGDGFTAGIIASLALTLEYLTFGYREARRRVEWIRFDAVLFLGLLLALVAALVPLLAGRPVLADVGLELPIPLIGEVRLGRSLLFDIGIYLAVIGGVMSAIDALEEVIR
jgi:multisubunit Na+/H+ antiporter MnhB subunit